MTSAVTTEVELKLPSGRTVRAALATPAAAHAPGLVLVHEWWGLNDEMRAVASGMAGEGFFALAVDLYEGQSTSDAQRAREIMTSMDPAKARETLVGWIEWLKKLPACSGKVGALGFCMGGAWSLNASLATPVDATVVYYGSVQKTAEELRALRGPVLGHFGREDQAITPQMAEGFRQAMDKAGKSHEIHFYEASHAFARVGGPNYKQEAAALADQRSLAFLRKHLQ